MARRKSRLCGIRQDGTAPEYRSDSGGDLGYWRWDLLQRRVKTPDSEYRPSAREGMRFTDAHSGDAVCSPHATVCSLGLRVASRLKRPFLEPYDAPLIEAERKTLPGLLRDKGYRTACIGKWHLGWNGRPERRAPIYKSPFRMADTRGFDYTTASCAKHTPYCFIENDRRVGQPTAWKPDRTRTVAPARFCRVVRSMRSCLASPPCRSVCS